MPSSPAVLVVDDDPTARLIAQSMLRHLGIEADAVADGSAGVRMAADQAYDVILMDIQMPVLDGVEALRAIRQAPGGSAPRVLALTDRPGDGARMREIGFDGVLPKPFSVPSLQRALRPETAVPLAVPPTDQAEALMQEVRAHVHGLLGEDDEAFVADLVGAFVESTRAALQGVASVQRQQDLAGAIRLAHAVKGSAANVGLTSLAQTWSAIEGAARRGDAAVLGSPLSAAVAETGEAIGMADLSVGVA